MSKFYTNVHLYKNDILLRGYENGQRVHQIIPCKPYLFIPSKTGNSPYKTLKGKTVDRIDFENPYDARDFVNRYKDVSGFDIYGMTNYVYPFINDYYPSEIDYDPKQI